MPAKSQAQFRFMKAAENNPFFAKKAGIKPEVAAELVTAIFVTTAVVLAGTVYRVVLDVAAAVALAAAEAATPTVEAARPVITAPLIQTNQYRHCYRIWQPLLFQRQECLRRKRSNVIW